MSIESLYPYAGNHAIQNAVFALGFHGIISDPILKRIEAASLDSYGRDFDPFVPHHAVAFSFDMNKVGQASPKLMPIGGFQLQRQSSGVPQIVTRSLTVSPSDCVLMVADYSRWATVKIEVAKYVRPILAALGEDQQAINSIGLQYTDVFTWRADPAELNLIEVFAPNPPYLVPNVLSPDGPQLWHSHHGYFKDASNSSQYKQLDNINVSRVADVSGTHSIQILTSHKAQLSTPMWQVGSEDNFDKIFEIFEALHDSNKEILRSLLSSEVLRRIKFDAPKAE